MKKIKKKKSIALISAITGLVVLSGSIATISASTNQNINNQVVGVNNIKEQSSKITFKPVKYRYKLSSDTGRITFGTRWHKTIRFYEEEKVSIQATITTITYSYGYYKYPYPLKVTKTYEGFIEVDLNGKLTISGIPSLGMSYVKEHIKLNRI